MKKQKVKSKKTNYKKTSGITLIALVVTIIVLVILAGISIIILSGDNGILQRTIDAKNKTDIAEIKEQAELIKQSLLINKTSNNETLTQEDLIIGIASDSNFEGSEIDDSKIITSDEKYDINIDSNLNITVTEHNYGNNIISIAYNELQTESRAIILQVQVLDGEQPSIWEWKENARSSLKAMNEEELKEEYARLNGADSWNAMFNGAPFNTVKGFYDYGPKNSGQYIDEYDYIIKTYYKDEKYNEIYPERSMFTTLKCNGQTATTKRIAEFVITNNGTYKIKASNEEGDTGNQTVNIQRCLTDGLEEKFSDIQTSNYVLSKDGYEVLIPAGFAYGVSNNIGSVTSGLVITDKIDSKHNSIGNEFVWIPIDKENLTVGKTDKKMAKKTSGKDSNLNDNYEGVLYDFYGTSSDEMTNYGQSTNNNSSPNYREPAYLKNKSYGDEASHNNKDSNGNKIVTETSLQEEYNLMISSVKKYGGFYVARYEMGYEDNKAISKLAVIPSSTSSVGNYWYGLYLCAKTYGNSQNSIVSNMIYGSQWDAMLNFALTNQKDNIKVSSNGNGNDLKSSDEIKKTGLTITVNGDRINNIYDLEGNMFERTQEAYKDQIRVNRGYLYGYNNSKYPSSRFDKEYNGSVTSTRMALYIK